MIEVIIIEILSILGQTITVSKEKSRRHIQIDMYAPKGEVLRSRIEY